MNITLNKSSWHFKIYSKVVSETPPKSLCPYFWTMIALTVFSPIILLFAIAAYIGAYISSKFPSKKVTKKSIFDMTTEELKEETEKLKKRLRRSEITGKIVFGVWIAFMFIMVIIGTYFGIKHDGWFVFFRGLFCLVGMATSIYWFVRGMVYIIPKITDSNIYKVPVSMIESVYTKTCPIINWK